jgi:Acetyltransferase (GNAT) domain
MVASAQRVISEEFRIEPFPARDAAWEHLAARSSAATIYHESRWRELLARAYGLNFSLAALHGRGGLLAGCLLARSRSLFANRLVALPFSDYAPPLAVHPIAQQMLMHELAAYSEANHPELEIRGIAAPPPWVTVNCFQSWRLDLSRSLAVLERGFHTNFRRRIRRARAAGVRIERGTSSDHLARFYRLHLETRRRLGVPPQPLRFFHLLQQLFSDDSFEIWLASYRGRDSAAEFILRSGEMIYGKWNARRLDGFQGANHLLLWNVVEEYAGRAAAYDLGRTDVRNHGLVRFKREMGCDPNPIPYCYFPAARANVSPEVASGPRKLAMKIWQHLPVPLTRAIGTHIYRYLG